MESNDDNSVEMSTSEVKSTTSKSDAPGENNTVPIATSASTDSSQNDEKKNVIIDLDSDDDDDSIIEVRKIKTNCINDECSSGENLSPACGLVLSYYHVKPKRNSVQSICEDCESKCLTRYNYMLNNFSNKESVFNTGFVVSKNYVELDDSDEDEKAVIPILSDDEREAIDEYLSGVFNKCNVNEQINKCINFVEKKCDRNIRNLTGKLKELDMIQDKLDKFRTSIYSNLHRITELEPIELDEYGNLILKKSEDNDDVVFIGSDYKRPKLGEILRPPVREQGLYLCEKLTTYSEWSMCKVMTIHKPPDESKGDTKYRIAFIDQSNWKYSRTVTGKSLAYAEPTDTRLQIGQRVIAIFSHKMYYAGIIAEPLSAANKFRYLVFFDDGYAKYVEHHETRLIVDVSPNVWDDIPIQSRNYIETYLKKYPDRPMMKAMPGVEIRTEWNGKWWSAKIKKIDCSLVLMHFEDLKRFEWIYRGSHRLGPLYVSTKSKTVKTGDPPAQPTRRAQQLRYNDVYVEYSRNVETTPPKTDADTTPKPNRAVARKSTTHTAKRMVSKPADLDSNSTSSFDSSKTQTSQAIVPFLPLNNLTSIRNRISYYTPINDARRLFRPHTCTPECTATMPPLSTLAPYNMLGKPIMAGWHRIHARYPRRREIRYVTPCNRSLRNIEEVHKYLTQTENHLSIDMFDFDPNIEVLAEYKEESPQKFVDDLSRGVETIPVPCVNLFEDKSPDYIRYTNQREPQDGVFLNIDEEFLCGCDCTDDCQDKKKCACWQLTIEGTKFGRNKAPDYNVGYYYKRLLDPVVTGIYECNSRCKCKSSCLNRVIQFPLKLKLQVFRTERRGWGLRTLSDVPRGTFICSYAGELLTESAANEGGKNFGDEYLAELDYIEVVERWKEGYESDVASDTREESDEAPDDSGDDENYSDQDEPMSPSEMENGEPDGDFVLNKYHHINPTASNIRTRLRTKKTNPDSSASEKKKNNAKESTDGDGFDDPKDKQLNHFEPEVDDDNEDWVPKYKSVRKMYGENERIYVMDAKYSGNVGRFLNHSCTPNVFVQNVFVETHDLRFPMVSFFTLCTVKAGNELTWNYNYDVGSVPDKVLHCFCGSTECRGRLL